MLLSNLLGASYFQPIGNYIALGCTQSCAIIKQCKRIINTTLLDIKQLTRQSNQRDCISGVHLINCLLPRQRKSCKFVRITTSTSKHLPCDVTRRTVRISYWTEVNLAHCNYLSLP